MVTSMVAKSHGREADDARLQLALRVAGAVEDPEIPAVTIGDLGMLRGAKTVGNAIVVRISPTYTGCPATQAIQLAVAQALAQAGLDEARVETVLSPPWTTDDISDAGRAKLKAFGIAPPERGAAARGLFAEETVSCPRCDSLETERISEFGSTPCKALWRCKTCGEPFDYFKCL